MPGVRLPVGSLRRDGSIEMNRATSLIITTISCMLGQEPAGRTGNAVVDQAALSFHRVAELPHGSIAPTLFVLDAQHVWVASETSVLATADGGRHWAALDHLHLPQSNRFSGRVRFSDPSQGIFFSFGYLIKTMDGGKSWKPVPVPAKYPNETNDVIFDVGFRNGLAGGALCRPIDEAIGPPNNAWCDQEGKRYLSATVFSTDDGGRTWGAHLMAHGAAFRIMNLYQATPTLVFGLAQDALFRSGDRGKSWEEINMASNCSSQNFPDEIDNTPQGISFVNERTGWLSYLHGDLLHTTDGGLHWCAIRNFKVSWRRSGWWTAHFERLKFTSDRIGWGVGGEGSVHYTQDGGQTWTKVHLSDISDLDVLPDGTVWAVGASGVFCSRSLE